MSRTGIVEDSCGARGSRDRKLPPASTGSRDTNKEIRQFLDAFDPDHPPDDVPLRRWRQFIADVRGFMASGFAEQAQALGTPADLYGCDDERPFARIDCMGLLWLLDGNRLVALTAETAIIEKAASRLTYRKKRSSPARVILPFVQRSTAFGPIQ